MAVKAKSGGAIAKGANMDFKPGEVVQLKSGGRGMTVVRQTKDQVEVIWYADSDDAVRTATLPAACVALIDFDDDEDLDDDED
jgi:uncharacterized protein YodC (DUF2158 family)